MQPILGLKIPETDPKKQTNYKCIKQTNALQTYTFQKAAQGHTTLWRWQQNQNWNLLIVVCAPQTAKMFLLPHFTYKVQRLTYLYHFLWSQSKDCLTLEHHNLSLLSSFFFHVLVLLLLNDMVASHWNLNTHQLHYNSWTPKMRAMLC